VLVADHRDALDQLQHTLLDQAARKAEHLEDGVRDFVRTQVLEVLTTQDEGEQNQLLALSQELCVHKAKETVLLERLGGMQQRQDVLRRQLTASKDSLARAEERLAAALDELVPLRACCSLPDSVTSVEQLVQQRDDARACMAKLTGQLQVERANLVRARDDTLAQIAAREQVEAREAEAAEALRQQRAAHEKELEAHNGALLEDMRRKEADLKAQSQAAVARQVPPRHLARASSGPRGRPADCGSGVLCLRSKRSCSASNRPWTRCRPNTSATRTGHAREAAAIPRRLPRRRPGMGEASRP
jgi:hypothetical protein